LFHSVFCLIIGIMKRAVKIFLLVLVIGLIVIQFFRPNFVNPPIIQAETLESSVAVPENVAAILNRSCADCHTNQTVYPWYANLQPSGWFLAHHIEDGRRHLNFSTWNTSDEKRKKRKLGEICEQVETREMPLPSYLWIHGDAKLTDEEIKTLCDWTKTEAAKLPAQ
jgi:hypothetical protein